MINLFFWGGGDGIGWVVPLDSHDFLQGHWFQSMSRPGRLGSYVSVRCSAAAFTGWHGRPYRSRRDPWDHRDHPGNWRWLVGVGLGLVGVGGGVGLVGLGWLSFLKVFLGIWILEIFEILRFFFERKVGNVWQRDVFGFGCSCFIAPWKENSSIKPTKYH